MGLHVHTDSNGGANFQVIELLGLSSQAI